MARKRRVAYPGAVGPRKMLEGRRMLERIWYRMALGSWASPAAAEMLLLRQLMDLLDADMLAYEKIRLRDKGYLGL